MLLIHSSNELYGADRMLLQVVRSLSRYTEVQVVLPDDATSPGATLGAELAKIRGVTIEMRPLPILRRSYMNAPGIARLSRQSTRLLKLIRSRRPDVVWCATSACVIAAQAARMSGVKRVVIHNQEIWSGFERHVLGQLGRAATDVVSISTAAHASLPSALRRRSRVIENGLAIDEPYRSPPVSEKPIFLVASRWNSWKGHGTLLKAWALAGEPGHLVIAGGPPPVGVGVDVAALISESRVERSTTIVGQADDIRSLIEQSHFVVVPSDSPEPFGLVAIESMAYGRPVIGSAGGGLGQIVRDGVDGFLFENKNAFHLADLLRFRTTAESVTLGMQARDRFRELYSESAYSIKLDSLWRELGLLPEPQRMSDL